MNFQSRYVHLYSHLPDLKIVVKKKEEYIFIDISECTNEKIKWKKKMRCFTNQLLKADAVVNSIFGCPPIVKFLSS